MMRECIPDLPFLKWSAQRLNNNAYPAYKVLVYTTRESPKMAQFDWFAISGYCAVS